MGAEHIGCKHILKNTCGNFVMLSVCNAVIGEEEEMERCHVEDLLQSNLTARSSEGFQTWFGKFCWCV